MKLTSMAILFLLILLPIMVIGDMKYEAYEHAESLKRRYDVVLEKAVHDGAKAMIAQYIESETGLDQTTMVNPMLGIRQFIDTLSLNLGRKSEGQKQDLLLYLPCLLVIDFDGFYVYGAESFVDANGQNVIFHVLKPKIYFTRLIGDQILTFHVGGNVVVFDTVKQQQLLYTLEEAQVLPEFVDLPLLDIKKRVIAETVERALNAQVNQHNRFAHQNGIAYTFYIPQIHEDELFNAFSDVGLVAFFQGMPLGGAERLNLYALGGSRLFKRASYYGYTRDGIRTVCTKAHSEGSGEVPDAVFHTRSEAAKEGYFPCESCRP